MWKLGRGDDMKKSTLEQAYNAALTETIGEINGDVDSRTIAITPSEILQRFKKTDYSYRGGGTLAELQSLVGMAAFETDYDLAKDAADTLAKQFSGKNKKIFHDTIIPELMTLAQTHQDQRVRFQALNTIYSISSNWVTLYDDNQEAARSLMSQLLDCAESEENKPHFREQSLMTFRGVMKNNRELVNESDVSRLSVMGYTASGGGSTRQTARSVLETIQTLSPDILQQKGDKSEWQERIRSTFKALQEELPDVLRGTAPIAMGSFGMVANTGDGNVTKIFLRGPTPQEQQERESFYRRELDILKRVGELRLDGVNFPHLGGTLEYRIAYGDPDMKYARHRLYDFDTKPKIAFAGYVMTKLSGREINWDDFVRNSDPSDVENHFRNVGAVLAQFHIIAPSVLGDITPLVKPLEYGTSVAQVPSADSKTNRALAICNDYLQANMRSGVSHGDFHCNNFRVNDDNDISGMFDFSFAGVSQNHLYDFANIPEAGLPYVVKEYEGRTGKTIDPTMITLTKISQAVAIINWHTERPNGNPEFASQARQRLTTHLNSVQHVTGLSFEVDHEGNFSTAGQKGDHLLDDFYSARSANTVASSPQDSRPKLASNRIMSGPQ